MEGKITISLTTKEAETLYFELEDILRFVDGTRDDEKTTELYKILGSSIDR